RPEVGDDRRSVLRRTGPTQRGQLHPELVEPAVAVSELAKELSHLREQLSTPIDISVHRSLDISDRFLHLGETLRPGLLLALPLRCLGEALDVCRLLLGAPALELRLGGAFGRAALRLGLLPLSERGGLRPKTSRVLRPPEQLLQRQHGNTFLASCR